MSNTRFNTSFFNNTSINNRSVNVRPLSQPFSLLLGVLLFTVFCGSITPKAFAASGQQLEGLSAKASLKPIYTTADRTPTPIDNSTLANALQKINGDASPAGQPETKPQTAPAEAAKASEPTEATQPAAQTASEQPAEKPAEKPSGTLLDVPSAYSANTGFKSFMDYRTLTNRQSKQYALQQSAYTDEQGFRRYNGYYMIALGTYYTNGVGERFRITLEGGQSFLAITGDIKSDAHTDRLHQHRGGNIVEFIVDRRHISSSCQRMGDMSYAGFSGRIASIEKLN